ncbi:hypothetical protein [Cellvibrio sp. PSBB006]|uniref:hypothetical protein n=1 Tax=Cellvibrio sp. PSBB006 TaxID=1987723 RepID=UPI000B3B2962|nr:hypothetical protein [Cellvibrio sp. PSBB006]ARU29480.1 hypothetical protein CBR65_19675 [Cellvibrio sp. PSBB006]
MKGALSLAECKPEYKVDCTLILNNGRDKKDFVLRTAFDSVGVWKAKNTDVPISPFQGKVNLATKEAAIIDGDVWVFGVDATKANDIFIAVKIGMDYHRARANDILGDVYVKNLNAENQDGFNKHDLVIENKKLYAGVVKAVVDAAKLLGVQGLINFYVISSNINHKIPKDDLHEALKEGGAKLVETDNIKYNMWSGSNDGESGLLIKQNLHLASLKV